MLLFARPTLVVLIVHVKVAVLTYKFLYGCAPSYLGPFVRVADLPCRQAVRSPNISRLIQSQSNRSTVGDPSLSSRWFQVWNSLIPEVTITSAPSLDTFRRRLKTHVYRVMYVQTYNYRN